MKATIIAALAASAMLLTGCASIISGPTQTVSVMPMTSGKIAAGQCTLTNKKGSWIVPAGGTVTVKKSGDALQARCEDSNSGTLGAAAAEKSTQVGWAVANFFLWDLCTISCLIDFSSGSIYQYPSQIQVVMYPSTAAEATQTQIIAPVRPKPSATQTSNSPYGN